MNKMHSLSYSVTLEKSIFLEIKIYVIFNSMTALCFDKVQTSFTTKYL